MDWLNTMHVYGIVSDGEVPGLRTATFEGVANDIVATVPVLKGDQGEPGAAAPAVDMQIDPTITDPTQLPTNLGLDDKGKTWWIGDLLYYWTGTEYVTHPAGYPGRPGPTPQISISMELIAPSETSSATITGTAQNPHIHFKIAAPRGIPGPAAAIRQATDYNNTLPPTDGQVPTWDEEQQKWKPTSAAGHSPSPKPHSPTSLTSSTDAYRSCPISCLCGTSRSSSPPRANSRPSELI
jgi:hypothetical protein